jgi:hypothetical protein
MEQGGTDFAVVAYREDGACQVAPLPGRVTSGLELLLAALRAQPSEGETIGLTSIDDDYFVAIRLTGSRQGAAVRRDRLRGVDARPRGFWTVWISCPRSRRISTRYSPGDLGIFADLGMDAMEMGTPSTTPILPGRDAGEYFVSA